MTRRCDPENDDVVDDDGNEHHVEEPGEEEGDGTHPVRGRDARAEQDRPAADEREDRCCRRPDGGDAIPRAEAVPTSGEGNAFSIRG